MLTQIEEAENILFPLFANGVSIFDRPTCMVFLPQLPSQKNSVHKSCTLDLIVKTKRQILCRRTAINVHNFFALPYAILQTVAEAHKKKNENFTHQKKNKQTKKHNANNGNKTKKMS